MDDLDGELCVEIPHEVIDSLAWRRQRGAAIAILIQLCAKAQCHGQENGRLTLSLREAAATLHMSVVTAHKALGALVEMGFLRRMSHKPKSLTRYAITFISVGNKPPTNDWRRWSPHEMQLAA